MKNQFLLLPSERQSARGQLPSERVDKHIWGNVRLVQANLILLNHYWQKPVSHPALSDAAVTAENLWSSMSFIHSYILPWAFHTSLLSWLHAALTLHLHLSLTVLICFLKASLEFIPLCCFIPPQNLLDMLFQHTLTDKYDFLKMHPPTKVDRFSCDDFSVFFFLQDIYIPLFQYFQCHLIFGLAFVLLQGFNFLLTKKKL